MGGTLRVARICIPIDCVVNAYLQRQSAVPSCLAFCPERVVRSVVACYWRHRNCVYICLSLRGRQSHEPGSEVTRVFPLNAMRECLSNQRRSLQWK